MSKDQALRLALEWIEAQPEPRMIGAQKAIIAIKQALEETPCVSTEPEPVTWRFRFPHGKQWHYTEYGPHEQSRAELTWQNLYTSPPKREPLIWQFIESAPKDTDVLVYGDGATHVARLVKNGWAIDDGGGLAYINTPTHWMPLPKPPIESAHGIKENA